MSDSGIDQHSLSPPSSPSTPPTSPPSTPPNLYQNTTDPSARWLVQKFGGTSVGKFAVQIAKNIILCVHASSCPCTDKLILGDRNYIDQHKIAIVCSARSGSTKALGTTNLLLKASSEAKQRPSTKAHSGSEPMTPVTNGLFRRPSEGSSPRTRSSSPNSVAFSFTPLNEPQSGQNLPEFCATVDLIRSEHLAAAKASIETPEILQEIEAEIHRDCDSLRAFLLAAQVRSIICPRWRLDLTVHVCSF